MRDKRPVDELSIEELERILAIRKREARMERLRHYEGNGRVVAPDAPIARNPKAPVEPVVPEPEIEEEAEPDDSPELMLVPEKGLPKDYF
jgi:hypothetical protein